MRFPQALLSITVSAAAVVFAQVPEACIASLHKPTYRFVAVSGRAWDLNWQGALQYWIPAPDRGASLDPACEGPVRLKYRFVIEGEPSAEPRSETVVAAALGQIVVRTNPPLRPAPEVPQACIDALQSKAMYPPLARQARISGPVTASFRIGPDGRATDGIIEGHPLLTDSAKRLLAEAAFGEGCQAREISLLVRYRVLEKASDPPVVRTRFVPPNELVVETTAALLNYSSAASN